MLLTTQRFTVPCQKSTLGTFVGEVIEHLTAEGRLILNSAQLLAEKEGIRVKTILAENIANSVANTIIEQSAKVAADLIVMGTHGRRGVSRLVMGSDAEAVMRQSSVPVMLVPFREPQKTTSTS